MPMNSDCIIKLIRATEILDSRGNPTVEVEIHTKDGISATASTPSGASTGKHEALELRDSDNMRYLGKGVLQAVKNINEKISPVLKGKSCYNQQEIDQLMIEVDGTGNMSTLGANATTAVSIACAKAAAKAKGIQLYQHISQIFSSGYGLREKNIVTIPVPLMNIINGGKHAGSGLAIQEFMIIPAKRGRISESIRAGSEIYHKLASILSSRLTKSATNVGDEGGFAPTLDHDELALTYIIEAISQSGYEPGKDIVLGIDVAASNLWDKTKQKYVLDRRLMNAEDLLTLYSELVDKYPLKYIEDPFMEEDVDSFVRITEALGQKATIAGDDIFVTQKDKVAEGIRSHAANGIIIKVNQVGTLTGAIESAKRANSASWNIIASHRSGETNDDWLADFAVGIGATGIKAGAPARGERVIKYNRLMNIEEQEEFESQAD
jgi:enolase